MRESERKVERRREGREEEEEKEEKRKKRRKRREGREGMEMNLFTFLIEFFFSSDSFGKCEEKLKMTYSQLPNYEIILPVILHVPLSLLFPFPLSPFFFSFFFSLTPFFFFFPLFPQVV